MIEEQRLKELRRRMLATPKVFCTGNPDREYSVAAGIRELYPTATFACRSAGYDLTDIEAFKTAIKGHNIFVNASYIQPGLQLSLLNAVNEVWKFGHIVNIGSYHEDSPDDSDYAREKLALRQRSLELYTYRIRTTHVVMGGLVNGQPHTHRRLTRQQVAQTIKWVLDVDFDVPIITIEPEKEPW